MTESTKKLIQEKINSNVSELWTKGAFNSSFEELWYRQGVVMGVILSTLFFNDLSNTEIMEACGLTVPKEMEEK